MKKFFTLIAMAFAAVVSHAQSNDLQFCYVDGTVIPNGSIVEVSTPDPEALEYDEVKFESGIYIKNTTSNTLNATLSLNVTEISPESELSVCLGKQCKMYTVKGVNTLTYDLAAGSLNNMLCHWVPALSEDTDEYMYGTCSGEYTLKSGSTTCSTITVKFVYADPASINTVDANAASVVKSYDLQGCENANAKGIVIERLSNGSVRKVIK